MLITDSQVHVWAADTPERPWLPAGQRPEPHQPDPMTAERLLAAMNAADVERAVLVPPSWEGDRNDLALAAARAHPDRFAVMGRLAVEKPESRALVATWRQQSGMLGMRFTFHTARQKPWLTDGTADWLWPAAERAGVPLMVLPPGSLKVIDHIAERHPGLRLAIDHMALGRVKGEAAFAEWPDLLALAKRPNVAVKASAVPFYSVETYPFRDTHPYLRQVYDAFGPERMFWGTDLTRLPCSYRECITMFTEELPFLSATDKAWVMGRAACQFLGWALP